MRNIVVGILYPGVEEFLPDYIKSINSQTTKDFELFLFDNNFESAEKVGGLFDKDISVRIIPVEKESSAVIPRRKFITKVLRNEKDVENIIFTDTDDFFDDNRVELMVKKLETEDIVFTELVPVDVTKNKLDRESFLFGIDEVNFNDLVNKNMLGFSHTAIKWKHLDKVLPYSDDLKIGDWWFFAGLLAAGLKARAVKGTRVYYRQHDSNLAGIKERFTEKDILFGVEVKINQYQCLLKYFSDEKAEKIKRELEKILRLKEELLSKENMELYLNNLNNNLKWFCWWEYIDLNRIKSP